MSNPTLALFTEGATSYGPRLFIPAATVFWAEGFDSEVLSKSEAAHDLLKSLSCWRGSDKTWIIDDVEHHGYEFNKKEWKETLSRLGDAGFTFKPYTSSMKVE